MEQAVAGACLLYVGVVILAQLATRKRQPLKWALKNGRAPFWRVALVSRLVQTPESQAGSPRRNLARLLIAVACLILGVGLIATR